MKIGWSSSNRPRFKVRVLGEGYAWIPKTPSFAKVLRRRFGKSKASGSRSVRRNFLGSLLRLQEVKIPPTLIIFHSRGYLVEF